MCGIAGILNGKEENLEEMLSSLSHRGTIRGVKSFDEFSFGEVRLPMKGKGKPPWKGKRCFIIHNGEFYESKKSIDYLEIEEFFYKNRLKDAFADFAFALYDGNLYLGRDFPGIRPLYFSKEGKKFAFASEGKALKRAGFEKVKIFPPGFVLDVSEWKFKRFYELKKVENAKEKLKEVFPDVIKKMSYKKQGVFFSGGIDSTTVAKLLNDQKKVLCVVAGKEGSKDVKNAKEAARILGLDLEIVEIKEKDVLRKLPKITYHIETKKFLDVVLAIPLYFAGKRLRELKYKVVFSGQGSDELFAGYWKYKRKKYNFLREIKKYHTTNLERDDKIISANTLEGRFPFLMKPILEIAYSLTFKEKTTPFPKQPLRDVAKHFGIPEEIAFRKKKAMQYGSGISKMLRKLLRKHGGKILSPKHPYQEHSE